ncbi:TetR/AcrR family transcriptional regulator [Tsukamurella tyrosinosolvens]|nr:TetR/AcrR family transcriptional regulator [Tsukamurella tyrosinosolvens]
MSAMPPARRTQKERTEATRTALLEATVDCLIDHGYAGTSTNRVVERAGLTRGALAHHFPTRDALIVAAVEHVVRQQISVMREMVLGLPAEMPLTATMVLDVMWAGNQTATSAAGIELWVAGRTNRAVSAHSNLLRDRIAEAAAEVIAALPGVSDPQRLTSVIVTCQDAIRGLVVTALGDPDTERTEQKWHQLRDNLLPLLGDALSG